MKTICGTSRCYVDFKNRLQLVGHIFLFCGPLGCTKMHLVITMEAQTSVCAVKIYRARYHIISCEVLCHFLLSISIQFS